MKLQKIIRSFVLGGALLSNQAQALDISQWPVMIPQTWNNEVTTCHIVVDDTEATGKMLWKLLTGREGSLLKFHSSTPYLSVWPGQMPAENIRFMVTGFRNAAGKYDKSGLFTWDNIRGYPAMEQQIGGQDIIDYTRGIRAKEGTTLRHRSTPLSLGTMVNSFLSYLLRAHSMRIPLTKQVANSMPHLPGAPEAFSSRRE